MTGRTVVGLAAVLAVLVPVSAASARPMRSRALARTCRLVVDGAGDADQLPLGVGANPTGDEPSYDIVSADIATNDDTVTAVIRVLNLSSPATTSPMGEQWRLDFDVAGSTTTMFLQAYSTQLGLRFDLGYVDGGTSTSFTDVDVTGAVDVARNEVRISAPVAAVNREVILARGSTVTDLVASAGRFYSTAGYHPSLSERTDEATGHATYVAGTPSCVAVGR